MKAGISVSNRNADYKQYNDTASNKLAVSFFILELTIGSFVICEIDPEVY